MEKFKQTPSQTIGPFFAYSLTAEQYGYHFSSIADGNLIDDSTQGAEIWIQGKIFDGNGQEVHDAMIELWQADHQGTYHKNYLEEGFKGFGRFGTGTRADKSFYFRSIKPGSVNGQAPHINVILFMRGSLHTLYTRLYFPKEILLNETDPILKAVPKERRETLIAERTEQDGKLVYHFDIHMQGDKETVFFEV